MSSNLKKKIEKSELQGMWTPYYSRKKIHCVIHYA